MPECVLDASENQHLAWQETLAAFDGLAVDSPAVDAETWVATYEKNLAGHDRQSRKKGHAQTGVFYTPAPIARYLVERTLGLALNKVIQEIREAFGQGNPHAAAAILQRVRYWRIIDPACGTGVFLREAALALRQFERQLAQEMPTLPGVADACTRIRQQLFGIDIDPLAVRIASARLSACLPVEENSQASDGLETTLQVGNTLLAAPNENSSYDFILGNPPFVSEVRGQAERFRELREHSPYYQAKMDLCDAFLAWGVDHLNPGGQLAFVLPEYCLQRTASAELRHRLWQEGIITELWRFPDQAVFADAPGHHSALLIWRKENQPSSTPCRPLQLGLGDCLPVAAHLKPATAFLDLASRKLLVGDPQAMALLAQLSMLEPLLQSREIQQGMVLPQGRLRARDRVRLPEAIRETAVSESGLFVLTPSEIDALDLSEAERHWLRPYFGPAGFQAFEGFPNATSETWVIYGDTAFRRLIQTQPDPYARLKNHLEMFAPVNTSAFAPYGLHRARQPEWFDDPRKILGPRQVMRPAFAVVPFPAYVNESFYSLCPERWQPQAVTALLNSRLSWFWFYHQKRKGSRLQIDKDVLSVFPAPPAWPAMQVELAALGEALSQLGVDRQAMACHLNHRVYAAYGLSQDAIEMLENWQPA